LVADSQALGLNLVLVDCQDMELNQESEAFKQDTDLNLELVDSQESEADNPE